MNSVCLAILNYNGRKHLEFLLPTAVAAAKNYPGQCSVLVLDNRSPEPDVDWIRREFPAVSVVVAPENDFLFSYNWLLPQLSEEIVVILNNDLRLEEHFLQPLLRHFQSADVFAVSATSRDWDDTIFTCGPAWLKSHHGIYHWNYDRERQVAGHTLFCSGGFMAVDRKKFLELGGFNRLFWPAYGEDLDLGFRAWRAGWRCLFEPASLVYHRENGSFVTDGNDRTTKLVRRCQLLFQWSTLPAAAGWWERTAMLLISGFRFGRQGDWNWLWTWWQTWFQWRRVRRNYQWMKISSKELSEILKKIQSPMSTFFPKIES